MLGNEARVPSSPTLWLGVANLAVYGLTYGLVFLAAGYHLSKDLPDGVVCFNVWMLVGSPILSLATVIMAVREFRRSGGRRGAFLAGLVMLAVTLGVSVFAISSLFGVW